jgi:hypothetical protein
MEKVVELVDRPTMCGKVAMGGVYFLGLSVSPGQLCRVRVCVSIINK